MIRLSFMCALLMVLDLSATAAQAEPQWITHPALDAQKPVVLHFRREVNLDTLASAYLIDVSADNRFVLYVNGRRVAQGPSRGDLAHWRYQQIDIRPYLRKGKNIVAAEVWNSVSGGISPLAQISARTGFWIRGTGKASVFETGAGWRVSRDPSRTFAAPWPHLNAVLGGTYYAAGNSEIVDASKADWTWNGATESRSDWVEAVPTAGPAEVAPWTLEADRLPAMRYSPISPGKVVRTDLPTAPAFPKAAVTIAARQSAILLIDQVHMVSAYPTYIVSGGKGAKITVTYSEALYDHDKKKGDRNAIEDRRALGIEDTFLPDGQTHVAFRPLWWRTWRFLQIHVETADQPLTLEGLRLYQTGYPFQQHGYFKSDDDGLNQIWEIGWRTLSINAHETFMDSAYWEQLQYVGDTRIESVIAHTVSGDPRLTIQAIDAYGHSQTKDGMVQSAYPSSGDNIIPPFGLLWIGMMRDYAQYHRETAVLKRNLAGARRVLDWYAPYVATNGLVGMTPYWNYIDWAGEAQQPGEATRADRFPSFDATTKTSCVVTLSYLGALKDMAAVEMAAGDPALASQDLQKAETVTRAIQDQCWDARTGLYADSPDRTVFSQHANALAVLYDVAPKDKAADILRQITKGNGVDAPTGMIETSYYFSWYLIKAFDHADLDTEYLGLVKTWRDLLKQNFTTWPETRGETRSDTHAWSAHPTADLIGIVAGLRPDATGYRSAVIAPHLGTLKAVDAATPTPNGRLSVRYRVTGKSVRATITVPKGLPTRFVWQGKSYPLHAGRNRLNIPGL
ncbi:hypothetical protein MMA231_03820 (plasmid) [Asticcacaulis sp. MM231]|uniref:alpha-L-rhamnosidase-related protein n=1 Tax=Asticcacaulis sp. MM231 TaxID=3157666 RepID=UPI0032D5AFC5